MREAEERTLGKARLSTERVLRELERAIFADPRKLYDERGCLRPIRLLDDDTAAALASLDMDEIVTGKGPQRRAIGRTTKVRFVDKLVAIDRAMKHLGLFERDNRQRERNLVINVGVARRVRPVQVKAPSARLKQRVPPSVGRMQVHMEEGVVHEGKEYDLIVGTPMSRL